MNFMHFNFHSFHRGKKHGSKLSCMQYYLILSLLFPIYFIGSGKALFAGHTSNIPILLVSLRGLILGFGRTLQADVDRILGVGYDAHTEVGDEALDGKTEASRVQDFLVRFSFFLILCDDSLCLRVGSVNVVILYSYFKATRGAVKLLSRGSWEDLGNCCQRPKAEGKCFQDLLHYQGTMVWLFAKKPWNKCFITQLF